MVPAPTHWLSQGVDGRAHLWTAEPFAPGSEVFATFPSPAEAFAAVKAAEELSFSIPSTQTEA